MGIHAYLAAFAAFYFSFIPFLYVLNWLDLDKSRFFIGLLLLCLLLHGARILLRLETRLRSKMFACYLVLPFSVYAFASYVLSTNHLNDTQTVLVLTVINPIFVFLAIFSSQEKETVFKVLYVLAFVYFVFIFVLWWTGSLVLTSSGFLFIFGTLEVEGYQNTNTYLGFLVLLVVGFYPRRSPLLRIAAAVLMALTLFFMVLVGARASMVAVVLVLCFWFLSSVRTMRGPHKLLIALVIVTAAVALAVFTDFGALTIFQGREAVGVRRMRVLLEGGDPSQRIFLFTKAIELFTLNAKNVFFGAGMNFFPVHTKSFSASMYPHNIILELLAEYGAFGFLLFSLPAANLLYLRLKNFGSLAGNGRIEKLAFMLFLYYFCISSFTGGLRTSWLFIFGICLPLTLG